MAANKEDGVLAQGQTTVWSQRKLTLVLLTVSQNTERFASLTNAVTYRNVTAIPNVCFMCILICSRQYLLEIGIGVIGIWISFSAKVELLIFR